MSNISRAFENGKAFIGFATAGDPDMETSEHVMLQMARGGCDLIEIGIPFSDPIAEGPRDSSGRPALAFGRHHNG